MLRWGRVPQHISLLKTNHGLWESCSVRGSGVGGGGRERRGGTAPNAPRPSVAPWNISYSSWMSFLKLKVLSMPRLEFEAATGVGVGGANLDCGCLGGGAASPFTSYFVSGLLLWQPIVLC